MALKQKYGREFGYKRKVKPFRRYCTKPGCFNKIKNHHYLCNEHWESEWRKQERRLIKRGKLRHTQPSSEFKSPTDFRYI